MGMNKSNICRSYRDKYPELPSLKLARIIYQENKLLFKNVESVRSALRYIEGKRGKALIKSVKESKYYKEEAGH